ncbi:O-antigen ligase family protein [Aquirufa sp. 5-AUSEE-100C1]
MSFDLAVCFVIILLYLVNYKQRWEKEYFPLEKTFWLYSSLYILNCFLPVIVVGNIPRVIISIILFSYVYFLCIQDKRDLKFAIKSYLVFSLILCGNGLIELFFSVNPLDEYIQSIAIKNVAFFSENDLSRFIEGKRIRSFIPHAISYGVVCVAFIYMILYFLLIKSKVLRLNLLVFSSVVLLLSGVLTCGSRTPIIGLIPLVFFYNEIIQVLRKNFLSVVCGIICISYFVFDYILFSIQSLINPIFAEQAGGSDSELRMTQLETTIYYFSLSPILGNGQMFDMSKVGSKEIGGAESVWFPLLAQSGIIGFLAYISIYIGLFSVTMRLKYKWMIIGFVLSWLLMRTATSLVGVGDSILFSIFFLMYKHEKLLAINPVLNKKYA